MAKIIALMEAVSSATVGVWANIANITDAKAVHITGLSGTDRLQLHTSAAPAAVILNEAVTIPAPTGPYTRTANHGADYLASIRVREAVTNILFQKVTGTPAAGQYTVSNVGVYTFHASDATADVLLDYLYIAHSLQYGTDHATSKIVAIPERIGWLRATKTVGGTGATSVYFIG